MINARTIRRSAAHDRRKNNMLKPEAAKASRRSSLHRSREKNMYVCIRKRIEHKIQFHTGYFLSDSVSNASVTPVTEILRVSS